MFLTDGIDVETEDLTGAGRMEGECPELPRKCTDSMLLCSGSIESGVRPKSQDCRGAVGMTGEHGDSTMDGRLILLWPGFRVWVWYVDGTGIDWEDESFWWTVGRVGAAKAETRRPRSLLFLGLE